MAKKNQTLVGDLISDLKKSLTSASSVSGVPDIMSFCYDKEYLGFSYLPNPIKLKPVQELVLKIFYRGSLGNEGMELSEAEVALADSLGLNDADKGNILKKYYSNHNFRELVLVWGRRSGKDFLSAIIALYEAMKLLEVPGGDPHAFYNIAAADIHILTVANSQGQAGIAFTEIREKLLASKYFQDKFAKDGIETSAIYLLTPKDRSLNRDFEDKGMSPKTKGSVVIEVGHSNSASLLGKSCFVLILDEVASYKNTGGVSSGDRIYSSLQPTIATYFRKVLMKDDEDNVIIDDEGNEVFDSVLDGKVISISSPRGKEGKLWDLFSQSDIHEEMIACRLPTWEVWPERSRNVLRKANSSMSEEDFMMEFGAEFSGTAGTNYFSEDHVKACFTNNVQFSKVGRAGHCYFVHLDPANTSNNYGLAIVHKEIYLNEETRKTDYLVVVDLLRYWHPLPNKPVITREVDKFVIDLKQYFHIGMVTFDSWASQDSMLRLRKAGIPHKETRFTNRYKMVIYSELADLVNSGRLVIPNDGPASALLMAEMLDLQRKVIPTGYRIGKKTDGDGAKSDDLTDSLAGACFAAINTAVNRLPQGKLVNTGVTPQSNERMWQGMQGPMGYGLGQTVSNALEHRQPHLMSQGGTWPPNRVR